MPEIQGKLIDRLLRRIFRIKKWRILTLIVFIIALNGLIVFFNLEVRRSAYMCSKCAAFKDKRDIVVIGIRLFTHEAASDSSITLLRERYIAPCSHDWVQFSWPSEKSLPVRKSTSHSPFMENPVFLYHIECSNAIQLFENDEAKVEALEAIGNRDNYVRWIACAALRSLVATSKKEDFEWNAWWENNKKYFNICFTIEEAHEVVAEFLNSQDEVMPNEAIMNMLFLSEYEGKHNNKPDK